MKEDNRKHQQAGSTKIKKKLITPEKKKGHSLFIILAFFITVILYLQTVKFGFTHFDDDVIIVNNMKFLSNIGNAKQVFLTDAFIVKSSTFYRPLQTLSYMVDIKLSGGNNTWMYHLSNILFIGAISCLLYLLLLRFLIPPKLALLSTLIFCAHPLFVSTIAFIPTRGELLLIFFALLSFLFLIEFLHKSKIKFLFLHWAAFTMALFCKETAAFLPFLFILYFLTFHSDKRFEIKHLFTIVLYAVSGMLWLWLRNKAIGNYSNPNEVFGLTAIIQNIRTIPECFAKFFLPFDFAPIPGFTVLKTSIGLGILILIIIMFFKNKERSKKDMIFCFSWFLILMVPPMLFKGGLIDYFDHRFFLPLLGILLFLLFLFPKKWFVKGDIKRTWLMIVVIIILSSFTIIKSRAYSDPMTFYNSAVSHNPHSAIAYFNRGILKSDKNDFNGCIEDFNNAININPYYSEAYCTRGIAKGNLGDIHGAVEDFNKAIALNPNLAEAYQNRGVAYNNLGNIKGAMDDFNKSISIKPNNIEVVFDRAFAKYNLKDFKGSIEDCDKALTLNPKYEEALKLKANALQELQKPNH